MSIVNADVAAIFDEIADLLEGHAANVFRVRAYRNAARMLVELGPSLIDLLADGKNLEDLPGIGPDLAAKITEVVTTGRCELLEHLRKQALPSISELLMIPGLGPKKAAALQHSLNVRSREELLRAAEQGRIRSLPGFGLKTEQRILESLRDAQDKGRRHRWSDADKVARVILTELASVPGVQCTMPAGSLRRLRDTVGDIDLLVVAGSSPFVMKRFTTGSAVKRVLAKGPTRASVLLNNGMQVDLRVVEPLSAGAAWLYFTGSKAHNIALRKMAEDAGLKLNEYGLFRGTQHIAGETEAAVYRALGLPFIEPELREERGEIGAARARQLPELVRLTDLKGDLHVHTAEGHSHDRLAAMAEAAKSHGLQYLAVTAHSRDCPGISQGLDAGGLSRHIDGIDALNARLHGIELLKAVEVAILEDGSLALPDALLQRLDLVVGAIHHGFNLSRDRQTERLLRAMENRCFSILAHPTGRLIGERPGCDIDLGRVIHAARERGCFLELNAHPARLDLTDTACRMARDEGVLVSIASGARDMYELENLRHGIGQARRGWLEAKDVLNTRSLAELRPLLAATMGATRATKSHPRVEGN